MWDIVFPKNNEKEFAEMAGKLGYSGLVCVYDKKPAKMPKTKVKLVAVTPNQSPKPVKASEKTRHLIESKKAGILYHLELVSKKDYVHHRGSGLNHVLAKLMHDRDQAVGFAFSELIQATPKKRGQLMGRMKQNIVLCRKYKVPIFVGSFATRPQELRSYRDIETFFTSLGMHPKEVKTGQAWLQRRLA